MWAALLPLFDGAVLTSEGAVLRMGLIPSDITTIQMIAGLGNAPVTVEGLTIDGDCQQQTGTVKGRSVSGSFCAIVVGNRATVRDCTIQNCGGCAPTLDAQGKLVAYTPQTDYQAGEPYALICGSDCDVRDNIIRQCWAGAITAVGCRNRIHDNLIEDVGANGIALWMHLDYTFTFRRLMDPGFFIYQQGRLDFCYQAKLVTFHHLIRELDPTSGSLDIKAFDDQLFPQNRVWPTGRTLTPLYRGGLAFYLYPHQSGIFEYRAGQNPDYAIAEDLVIEFSGELRAL